jgi:hypothetical protein
MKNLIVRLALLCLVPIFARCEVVGGIFKAGMYWGIFLVVAVIVGIVYLVFRGKR